MKRADIYKVEGHTVVFDHDYLRAIPEFKVILERKITSPGDYDGRKKLAHWQLFMYIKMVADRFSFANQEGLGEKDLHLAAIKEARLDEKYKPDPEVKAAIEKFIEIQDALLPTLKTINSVLKGIKMSDIIAQTILRNMEAQIELYHNRIKEAEERGEAINEADQILLVDKLLAQLGNIQKIAIKMPDIIDNLEALEVRLSKEVGGDMTARGGRSIGNRAEPKRDKNGM